jgi:CheY-like chemotaxis protein
MPHILVVDDSDVDRRLAGGLLSSEPMFEVAFATNGLEALEAMSGRMPDLLLSDLQMPEMNGLQLLTTSRMQYPDVPVVLMTAMGSETLAVEAMSRGAASYVPKTKLPERLVATVAEVLALAQADRTHERLIGCLTSTDFNFELPAEPRLIDPLVDLLQQIASGMGLCDFTERVRLGVALKEALVNALFRGNLELAADELPVAAGGEGDPRLAEARLAERPYRERLVRVKASIRPEEARFVIRDDGRGFDVLAELTAAADPAAWNAHGRGLALMRALLDDVQYNASGTEVTLIKRRPKKDR